MTVVTSGAGYAQNSGAPYCLIP